MLFIMTDRIYSYIQKLTVASLSSRIAFCMASLLLISESGLSQTTYAPIHTQQPEDMFIYMPPAPPPGSNSQAIGWVLAGDKGYNGRDVGCEQRPGGGGDGYTPPPIVQTLPEQYTYANDDAIVYVSKGGNGGSGGDGSNQGICGNYTGRTGGKGAIGGDIDLTFNPSASKSKSSYLHTGIYGYTGIFLQSIGGDGGNGGDNGGNGGTGGSGGTVRLTNNVSFRTAYEGGYGILAQSLGGWGGNGADATGIFWSGDGGSGSVGAPGGDVILSNNGNLETPYGIPIFAQSLGGKGGDGGGSTALFAGSGGDGGYGGPGGNIAVKNSGNLSADMVGGFGIFAQSVGGGGGAGGAAAGLYALGANGGNSASSGYIAVINTGDITLKNASSSGLYAQSVGGGGGSGGMAAGLITIGGTGGDGGDGNGVVVSNTGLISTGNACAVIDNQGRCAGKWNDTLKSNGGAFGVVAQSIGGGGGLGGLGISSGLGANVAVSVAGSGGNGGSGKYVYINNSGSIATNEVNSSAILAQSIGGGGGSGGGALSVTTSFLFGLGYAESGSGGTGGNGDKVGINCPTYSYNEQCSNSGLLKLQAPSKGSYILTSGNSSPGILAQSIGGGGGNGGFSLSAAASSYFSASLALGGSGNAAGDGNKVYASPNGAAITTFGSDSPGIQASSIGGGGGSGGVAFSGSMGTYASIAVAMGGKGGLGGNANEVAIENINRPEASASSIATSGDRSHGLSAQSIGGGGGNGGTSVAGSVGSATLNIAIGGSAVTDEKEEVVKKRKMSGGIASVSNDGEITTTGLSASAIVVQSIGGGGGNGGASFSGGTSQLRGTLSVGGSAGNGGQSGKATVINNGKLSVSGGSAAGISAQSIAGGGGSGGMVFSGGASLVGFDGKIGGNGANGGTADDVSVTNSGLISTVIEGSSPAFDPTKTTCTHCAPITSINPGNSPGILAQSIGGGGGSGGLAISAGVSAQANFSLAVGGDGGDGGKSGKVDIYNTGEIKTSGMNSAGIIAQSIGGSGGSGGSAIGGDFGSDLSLGISLGGKASNAAESGLVNLKNSGQIHTTGAISSAVIAQSIGGTGGNAGNVIAGNASIGGALNLAIGGMGGFGGKSQAVSVELHNSLQTEGDQSIAVIAQSIGGSGGNGGNAITGSLSSDLSGTISFGGKGKSGGASGDVSVSLVGDSSSITTSGASASAIVAQSISGSGGNGGLTIANSSSNGLSLLFSLSGQGGNATDSVGVVRVKTDYGSSIQTFGDMSSGIVAQSIGGGGGNSGNSIISSLSSSPSIQEGSISIGGTTSAGEGGRANSVYINSAGQIQTSGIMSLGLIAQSIGGGGGNAGALYDLASSRGKKQGATLSLALGGSGGNAGWGGLVEVNQSGVISTGFNCEPDSKICNQSIGILAQSVGGGGGIGGSVVSLATESSVSANIGVGGLGGSGGKSEKVTVYSNQGLDTGGISTIGDFASSIVAQSIAGGGGSGGSSNSVSIDDKRGVTVSVGGMGGAGGRSDSVAVYAGGTLITNGAYSSAIFAQSIGGGGGRGGQSFSTLTSTTSYAKKFVTVGAEYGAGSMGVGDGGDLSSLKGDSTKPSRTPSLSANPATGLAGSISIGGYGGSGGASSTVDVITSALISTSGDFSQGIFAQSVGGGGGSGGMSTAKSSGGVFSLAAGVGGFGGDGGKAGAVYVETSNSITTTGLNSSAIYAQSVGGGGGQGGATATSAKTSATALALGIGGFGGSGNVGGSVTVLNNANLSTQSSNSSGIFSQSVGGGGGDGGTSYASAVSVNPVVPGTSAVTSAFKGKLTKNTAGSAADGTTSAAGQNDSQQGSQAGTDQGRSIGISMGGYGGSGGDGGKVSVINNADIQTGVNLLKLSDLPPADYSYAIFAQSIGGGGGTGGQSASNAATSMTSVAFSMGGAGAGGGNGSDVKVTNAGSLYTNGAQSAAIFAQSVGGGGGVGGDAHSSTSINTAKSIAFGLGGEGAAGGNAGQVKVISTGEIISTNGVLSDGIHAQSVGGGGGNGGSSSTSSTFRIQDTDNFQAQAIISLSNVKATTRVGLAFAAGLGGAGGAGGSGAVVEVANSSTINTSGNSSNAIFAQSIGGGGGNTGSDSNRLVGATYSIGLSLGSSGAPGNGGSISVQSNADINTSGHSANGIVAQSIGGGGGFSSTVNQTEALSGDSNINLALGAIGGANILAGGVSVGTDNNPVSGKIITGGNNSSLIIAQSVGGGGGLISSNNDVKSSVGIVTNVASLGATAASSSASFLKDSPSLKGDSDLVNVRSNASMSTSGANSLGILGQSIGGGGGFVTINNSFSTVSALNESYSLGAQDDSTGLGKDVSIGQFGSSITNVGPNSIAIAAQSIGGGGGLVLSNTSSSNLINVTAVESIKIGGFVSTGSDAGKVTVDSNSAISVTGSNAVGVLAQSIGGGGGLVVLNVSGKADSGSATIGGSSETNAKGSDVNVTIKKSITVSGTSAVGVLAQSVGGGGGALLTSGYSGLNPTFSAGSGNGGDVTVKVNAPISVSGSGSIGVIAQSVGGGGGIYVNENGYLAKSGGGTGTAGSVSVYVNDVIQANTGTGIYAGAAKGPNDPNITINKGAAVLATTGRAIAVDGLLNNLHNEGTIAVANSRNGIALDVKGLDGKTEIYNKGLISGALSNTGSNINILNDKDGRFYLPNIPNLGKGVFTNAGYLMFNHLGEVATANTNHTGSFIQTSTGVLGSRIDFATSKSDLLDISNSTQFALDGKIRPVLINTGSIKPGSLTTTLITSGAVDGLSGISNTLGVDDRSAIMSYALNREGNSITLTSTANFTPAGLSQFGSQVGQAIGSYQSAGSNTFFQTATAQLVEQPTEAALDQAYQGLAGTAVQAVPQVMFQAVSQGIGSYTDRINDWRVSTATSKSSRMTAFNQPKRYAMAKTGNKLFDAASDEGMIGGGRSGPWVSLFQSNVFSKSLTDRIVGGTIAYELENGRRDIMGGFGVTLSQSGYSYNSAPTPITPGNTTNVGLSFYGVGRGERAYISGTGYLGGGNTNFTRQLQTMNFNSNTNVNIMSYVAAARVEAGYDFEPFRRDNSNMKVTPFVAVQPTYIHQKGAQENFSNLGPGFNYSATDNTAVPVFAGLELSGNHMTEGGTKISPFVRASWMAETQQNGQMGANFNSNQGVNVFFNGSPNLGNAMMYKAGSVFGGDRMSGYFTLDYDYGNASYSYRNYGVTGGIKYAF